MSTLTPAQRATPSWLPPAPADWNEEAVKRRFAIQLGKMLQNDSTGPLDRRVPYLKAQHVQWERVITDDVESMWADPRELRRFGIRHGDLLVCEGGEVGRAAIVRNPPASCIIQNALHRVRVQRDGDARFLLYVLGTAAQQGWFSVLCNKATIAHFTSEKFGNLRAYFPSAGRQTAIADYLDRETGRLDGLIAKHERLLELLAEKRQSLINHAVTRGLDPSAPRKPSGLPWLGDVPAHWEALPIKRIAKRIQTGTTPPTEQREYYTNGTVPWFSPGSFGSDLTLESPAKFLSKLAIAHRTARLFAAESVFIITIGATLGKVAISSVPASCNQQLTVITFDPRRAVPRYAAYVLRSMHHVFVALAPNSTLPILNTDEVTSIGVPLPPLAEQRAIAAHLDAKLAAMAKLRAKVEAAIALLRERRTALIAAAVTGRLPIAAP
jgi:type I restriction enzyme, S subunit